MSHDHQHDRSPASGALGPVGMPRGPWLLVVGMHRSGTSAVTGACASLGFQAPTVEDRMDWPESNPEHWESLSLALHDDALLHHLGGCWDAPPELVDGWELGSAIRPIPGPAALAAAAFPNPGPVVWKDPRSCLLLPYWKRAIPAPMAAVLAWRSPMAVARSLRARDGLSVAHGLALWERYNRSALENLAGIDTYVVAYDRVLDDPGSTLGAVASWFSELDQFAPFAGEWEPGAMAAHFSTGLRHQSGEDDDLVLPSQRRLHATLTALAGGHRPLEPPALPDEPAWTTALIETHRRLWLRSQRVSALEDEIGRLHHRLGAEDAVPEVMPGTQRSTGLLSGLRRRLAGVSPSRVPGPGGDKDGPP